MAKDLALRIKLLGHFEAWRNDELLGKDAWPRSKVKTLLKVLLVERGQIYSHDQLVDALFSDLDPVRQP
jgi:DNA-binding SARP family transcriptional activator